MPRMVGVSFRKAGKIYYFDAGDLDINPGDWVVVETVRGKEIGRIISKTREISVDEMPGTIKNIIRKATPEDLDSARELRRKIIEAFKIGEEKIRFHELPMKLIDVEYTLDGSKMVFYFSSEGRVDFRELVKDLASVFRKRIELHQIGVRDESKMLGGLGPCGRPLCCATFLTEFAPVSIKMAKEQNLSLNPIKISGTCGRLMCCLKYEQQYYSEAMKELPPIGSEVEIDTEGTGTVVDLNALKHTVIVELPSKARLEISVEKIKLISKKERRQK